MCRFNVYSTLWYEKYSEKFYLYTLWILLTRYKKVTHHAGKQGKCKNNAINDESLCRSLLIDISFFYITKKSQEYQS